MTSKHLFLRGIKEDLRHKLWMLALSLLGSFLAMPMIWLLRYTDVNLTGTQAMLDMKNAPQYAEWMITTARAMADYFKGPLMLSSGLIAILGAVIVGLEAFHFLQQRSPVDTWHSLPVSRSQLFGIKYINGLLIWLVPHLLCTALTLVFSGILLARVGAAGGIPGLIWEAGKNTAILLIVFLMVYHLMLLATMLTGNMLNTLAVAGILGCGCISAYGLVWGFMTTFFHTYYRNLTGLAPATYTSPLAAPIILLGTRVDTDFRVADGLLLTVLACLAEALALGLLAWISYLKRPSERAGGGLDTGWIAGPLRLFTSVLGGMGGWLFMYYLRDISDSRTAWSVFGALLIGILTYGALDVISSMDFKAFFRHRWGMGASMIVMLLICVGFQQDWMGYDRYLPDQEQIQMASIASRYYGNYGNSEQALQRVVLTNEAQIYAFLERGIENSQGRAHKTEDMQVEEAYCGDRFSMDTFCVRIVLNNGDSYYRQYDYYGWDRDVVLPLLCSEEYAEGIYRLTEEQIESCISMSFSSGADNNGGDWEVSEQKLIRELAEAYNRDLAENPGAVILGQGRMMGQIALKLQQEYLTTRRLDLLEGMHHTLEVMEKNGIDIWNQPVEAEEVESISFQVSGSRYWYRGDTNISPVERSIRGYFGVFPDQLPEACEQLLQEPGMFSFTVTDPTEIEELLPLIQYSDRNHYTGVFMEEMVRDVSIRDRSGGEWSVCLRRGAMPEKFIQRFLEEAERQ